MHLRKRYSHWRPMNLEKRQLNSSESSARYTSGITGLQGKLSNSPGALRLRMITATSATTAIVATVTSPSQRHYYCFCRLHLTPSWPLPSPSPLLLPLPLLLISKHGRHHCHHLHSPDNTVITHTSQDSSRDGLSLPDSESSGPLRKMKASYASPESKSVGILSKSASEQAPW